jgi:hypothetical protein
MRQNREATVESTNNLVTTTTTSETLKRQLHYHHHHHHANDQQQQNKNTQKRQRPVEWLDENDLEWSIDFFSATWLMSRTRFQETRNQSGQYR